MKYKEEFEKVNGKGSANQFAAHAFDVVIVLNKAIPMALAKAKPGTPQFRAALKEAFETMGRTPVSQGVLNWTATDHFGYTPETGVLLQGGQRRLASRAVALDCGRLGDPSPAARRLQLAMDASIAGILMLDGVTNGAVYGLLALALVLVFAVTRVIFIPQGEFVAYGALSVAMLQFGKVPGTLWLMAVLAVVAALLDAVDALRRGLPAATLVRNAARTLIAPAIVVAVTVWAAPQKFPLLVQSALAVAIVTLLGPAGLPARLPAPGRCDRAGAADRLGRRALRPDRARPGVLRRRGLSQPELLGPALHPRAARPHRPDGDHLRRLRSP